jgi:NAD-dependent SIR2 family protein deacetylase
MASAEWGIKAGFLIPHSEFPICDATIEQAAAAIKAADALLIAAGAGMGVDSGLPDFRGNEGFWNAYPPYRKLGLVFAQLANPVWFRSGAPQAWGFYGHRLELYRRTTPHAGFAILKQWADAKPGGAFVFTSNVDGHFQKAGFDPERIVECHGSIHWLQCSVPCSDVIWPADGTEVVIDHDTMRASEPLPGCPRCGATARPNILMFGDNRWIPGRTSDQERRYEHWLAQQNGRRLVAIECGAGTAIPTVRRECERHRAMLVRVNLRDPQVPSGGISISLPALAALTQISERM